MWPNSQMECSQQYGETVVFIARLVFQIERSPKLRLYLKGLSFCYSVNSSFIFYKGNPLTWEKQPYLTLGRKMGLELEKKNTSISPSFLDQIKACFYNLKQPLCVFSTYKRQKFYERLRSTIHKCRNYAREQVKKCIFKTEILSPFLRLCSTYFLAATFPHKMEWIIVKMVQNARHCT